MHYMFVVLVRLSYVINFYLLTYLLTYITAHRLVLIMATQDSMGKLSSPGWFQDKFSCTKIELDMVTHPSSNQT